MTETITSSPGSIMASLNVAAMRLRPSVVPRVNTISDALSALRKRLTVSRACSCRSVACTLR